MTDILNFDIDYKKLKILETYNTRDIKFPVVLSIPHSGNVFPEEFLQKIETDEKTLHANEDVFVDELLKDAIKEGICTIKMNISRVFVDVNRDKIEFDSTMFADYPVEENPIRSKRCRYGIGVIHRIDSLGREIYPALLSYEETLERIDKVYNLYHKRLSSLINSVVKKFGYCLVLDAHSMPSKICTIVDSNKQIDCCLGDLFEQSCPKKISEFFANQLEKSNLKVSYNIPYSGAFITFNYCQPRKKIYTLQFELNRSLYLDEEKVQKNENFHRVSSLVCSAIICLAKKIVDFKI